MAERSQAKPLVLALQGGSGRGEKAPAPGLFSNVWLPLPQVWLSFFDRMPQLVLETTEVELRPEVGRLIFKRVCQCKSKGSLITRLGLLKEHCAMDNGQLSLQREAMPQVSLPAPSYFRNPKQRLLIWNHAINRAAAHSTQPNPLYVLTELETSS